MPKCVRFKLKREQITTVRALGSGNFGQVMNDDFRYMKFIYLHCGEEMILRPAPSWLVSSVGRALHRYCRGHGFKSRTGLNFFQVLLSTTRFSSVLSCEDLLISSFGQVFNAVYGPLRADVAVKLLKGTIIIFLSNLTVSSCPSPLNMWKGYPWHSSLCHSISIFLFHVR